MLETASMGSGLRYKRRWAATNTLLLLSRHDRCMRGVASGLPASNDHVETSMCRALGRGVKNLGCRPDVE